MESTPENDQTGAVGAGPMTLRWRLVLSFLIALTVTGLSGYVAWNQFSHAATQVERFRSLLSMRKVEQVINAYERQKQRLPSDLSQLQTFPDAWERGVRTDNQGRPVDNWNHPFAYWTDGTRYRIVSLGRDGKPGGDGLNYDLSSDEFDLHPKEDVFVAPRAKLDQHVSMSLPQFVTEVGARGMIVVCLLAGLLTFALSYWTLTFRSASGSRPRPWYSYVISLLAITLAALLLTLMIIPLHVPSGH